MSNTALFCKILPLVFIDGLLFSPLLNDRDLCLTNNGDRDRRSEGNSETWIKTSLWSDIWRTFSAMLHKIASKAMPYPLSGWLQLWHDNACSVVVCCRSVTFPLSVVWKTSVIAQYWTYAQGNVMQNISRESMLFILRQPMLLIQCQYLSLSGEISSCIPTHNSVNNRLNSLTFAREKSLPRLLGLLYPRSTDATGRPMQNSSIIARIKVDGFVSTKT